MIKAVVAGLVLLLFLAGCSSNKGLVGDEAINKVKPLKELEAQESTSANFIVRANNIADFSYSNKNRFELFLNKKLVRPQNEVDNATTTYNYEFRLQPGYYQVNGVYYWHDGWKERETKVNSKELVRVGYDRKTVLDVDIPKDWRGMVTDDELFFHVAYQSFFEEEQEPVSQEVAQNAQRQATGGKIRLQVNTDPDYCDVIIDDKMVGQTPISIWIDNSTSHVLQIKKENYRTVMRLLDEEDLRMQDKLIFIERLEPVNPFITQSAPAKNPAVSPPDTTAGASGSTPVQEPVATPTNFTTPDTSDTTSNPGF